MNYTNVHLQVPIPLEVRQEALLKDFIMEFLPPTESRRRGSHNELEYIWGSLNKVFKQRFGFNLARTHILDVSRDLGYHVVCMGREYDPDARCNRPVVDGGNYLSTEGYFQNEAGFIYLNVQPRAVQVLMRTTAQLPGTTDSDKMIDAGAMTERLRAFQVKWL